MKNQPTLQSVLKKAITREIESQELYNRLEHTAADDAARDIFTRLVQVEKKHEDLLRKYLSGELGRGTLAKEHVLDYKIAEYLEQPQINPDMKIDEVLLLAANREKASREFYLGLAGEHPPGEVKRLLEELASQELDHKNRMEFLYNEVAFPQTDGG